ncbi:MAG: 16S rRNA (guanine(966)-N(2))-methyltransferase RsmD [Deltaproteobacteria bacterium]|nr:16S rRNA (guanine(966)-N(2))-methyltransferase RsmD [Deltaproteobacteria bacterium]
MRIIGGSARGRRLHPPPGKLARPTSDRVRQSLFDLLGQRCDGLRVLDLFAGTGALGLEALSRGAEAALFVEREPRMIAVLQKNLDHLSFGDRATLKRGDALRLKGAIEGAGPFELVLADPPYAEGPGPVCEAVAACPGLIVPGGRLVVEHDRRTPSPEQMGTLQRVDLRRYGDTNLSLYREGDPPPQPSPGER